MATVIGVDTSVTVLLMGRGALGMAAVTGVGTSVNVLGRSGRGARGGWGGVVRVMGTGVGTSVTPPGLGGVSSCTRSLGSRNLVRFTMCAERVGCMSGSGPAQSVAPSRPGYGLHLGLAAQEEEPHTAYGMVGCPCGCPRCSSMRNFYGGVLRGTSVASASAGEAWAAYFEEKVSDVLLQDLPDGRSLEPPSHGPLIETQEREMLPQEVTDTVVDSPGDVSPAAGSYPGGVASTSVEGDPAGDSELAHAEEIVISGVRLPLSLAMRVTNMVLKGGKPVDLDLLKDMPSVKRRRLEERIIDVAMDAVYLKGLEAARNKARTSSRAGSNPACATWVNVSATQSVYGRPGKVVDGFMALALSQVKWQVIWATSRTSSIWSRDGPI